MGKAEDTTIDRIEISVCHAATRPRKPGSHQQIEVMATRLAGGKALPAEVVEHLVAKADGVPLIVEEMTKAVLGSNVLRADGDRYTLTGRLSEISIPASLHESLMARLDRLPTLREVAQLGAVLGRLVEAELLYQRGRPPRSRYIFKHALIQDAAYQSLLRRTRQQYHRQVAELLESNFDDTVEAARSWWRTITPRPACPTRRLRIGSRPARTRLGARPITRRSVI
jgi:predicted ATPase